METAKTEKVRKIHDVSGIDPESFHVPVSDNKGHNVQVVFRCQPNITEAITIMVQSRKFPYKNTSECIRHALVRHLGWLEGFGADVPSVTGQINAMNRIVSEEQRNMDFQGALDKLRAQVKELRQDDNEEMALKHVLNIANNIDRMPEGPWKRKYKSIMQKDFADIITSAPKMDLTQTSEEEEE